MKEELEKTIKVLAKRAATDVRAIEAMQLTQAALNAAHALLMISEDKK